MNAYVSTKEFEELTGKQAATAIAAAATYFDTPRLTTYAASEDGLFNG